MSSYSPTISFNDVSVSVGQHCLLEQINLTCPAGTWMGIVGPNGGGKSTLIKALMGQLPHNGEIQLTWPNKSKNSIGYVPQIAPFEPTLPVSVSDYLRLVSLDRPVWLSYKRNRQINEKMELLQISQFANSRIGALSTGERQRVLLCGALLSDPQILVLDEPLAGVDKQGHAVILDILAQFHRQGKSIVMVEHHWHVIAKHCQQVALIDKQLKLLDSPSVVLEKLNQTMSMFDLAKTA